MQPDPQQLTDEALLSAYRLGDRRSLGVLFQRYAHLVLGLCLDYLKHREDARDAVMDVFEKAARKLAEQEVTSFKSWLYQVSRNHCVDLLRRRVERAPGAFMEEIFVETASDGRPVTEQRIELLSEAIAELKSHQRDCVVLFYLRGKSYADVAAHTGYSENEVKSYLQNGRRNLKSILLKLEHERAE